MSLAPVTDIGLFAVTVPYPGPAAPPTSGPIVQIAFTLPLAGRVPRHLDLNPPQGCQAATPNVQLVVTVVDQDDNPVDLSGAQYLLLWLLAPDGTPRPVGARLYSNGLDGKISYTTNAQDLNQAGLWQVQAQVTFGASVLLTRVGKFRAEANLPDFPEAA